MLDRVTALSATAASPLTTALARRRALFAGLVGTTIAGVLWLAFVAVPPYSAEAISFLVLFTITLPWSVVGFWNATIGFLIMRFCRNPAAAVNPLAVSVRGDEPVTASTAILMCIRNESPEQVTRNLQPLMDGLVRANVAHLFHVYLLSDSSDPGVIAAETTRFDSFIATWQGTISVTYRRRQVNTAFKSGNIRDFCKRWGKNYDFAITLDADSFMPAETALRLVRIAQANPSLGILQTLVVGLPSVSVFARVFQFGMRLGMRSYTLGATWWQGDCGPYWGHNAIIRLAPFIAHCRMPVLPGNGPLSGHVLSHDQIEAALMRRAGYEVRVLPVDGVSWEENPPTLMEFSRRDLRWCQGNMQYWQLLTLPGLKPVSRFQLVFAIWMYLGSPAWMAMTAIGTVLLVLSEAQTAKYVPLKASAGTALFAIMMLMTFAPKIASMIDVLLTNSARRSFGGSIPFALNIAIEAVFMVLLTPIIALTHTIFLIRLFAFRRRGNWTSQMRESHAVPWRLALTKLWPQTIAGCTVLGVVAMKAPNDIGFALMGTSGLILAAPFAVATASPLMGALFARLGIGRIPEENERPAALIPLCLPALETRSPMARKKTNKDHV
jgi:membrane glycosyltransferase